MKTILNDIKDNRIKSVYLLYGEETYLVNQYKDKLLDALDGNESNMNFASFEGKDIDTDSIISLAGTEPFFSDYRIILISNSGFFKNTNDALCDYLKTELPDYLHIIFVESEVDKRNRLYKAVKDKGNAVEFATQDEATLRKWIALKSSKENLSISGSAVSLFLQKTGTDMSNISTELEKLFSYCLGKSEITANDIEAVTTTSLSNHIFDMITAVSLKNQAEAMRLYYELIALREAPMKILILIAKQFNTLLQIKDLKNRGYDKSGIAKKIGKPSFIADKLIAQASSFSYHTLRQALTDCVEYEEQIKTGRITDRLSIELIITKYSMR